MWREARAPDGAGRPAGRVPQVRRRVAVRRVRVHGQRARARVPLRAVQLRPVLRVLLLSRGAPPRAPAPVPPRVPAQPHRSHRPALQRVPRAARVRTGVHGVPQSAVPRVSRVLQRLLWSAAAVAACLCVCSLTMCGVQWTGTSTAWSLPSATRRTPSTTGGGTATAAARAGAACRRCSTARSAATLTSAATAPSRASSHPQPRRVTTMTMVQMMRTRMMHCTQHEHTQHNSNITSDCFFFSCSSRD